MALPAITPPHDRQPTGGSAISSPTPASTVGEIFSHLNERGYVAFHPTLAQGFGYKAAIFLGLSLYWMRKSLRDRPRDQGWFFMTGKQWEDATALGRRELETVRALLVDAMVLEERLQGQPARMHYRVRLSRLAELLGYTTGLAPTLESTQSWFTYCISYYKPLADLTGSPASGLYLSYLLARHRTAAIGGQVHAEIMHVSQDTIMRDLSLTPKTQRNARDRLKRAGLIRETGRDKVVINLPAMLVCLQGQTIKPLKARNALKAGRRHDAIDVAGASGLPPSNSRTGGRIQSLKTAPALQRTLDLQPVASLSIVRPVRPAFLRGDLMLDFVARAAGRHVGNRHVDLGPNGMGNSDQSGVSKIGAGQLAQNAKLEVPKSPNSVAQNAKLKLPKSPSHIQIGITNTTTTTRAHGRDEGRRSRRLEDSFGPGQAQCNAASLSADLIYPPSIESACLPSINDVLVRAAPDIRQALLDELQGQLLTGKTIHNPAGWLHGLQRAMQKGAVLALAAQVATQREKQRKLLDRQQQANAHASVVDQSRTEEAGDDAVKAEYLSKLKELRNHFGRRK
ncbi:hypothetical protein D8I35_03720 [Corticibacter populi]|uniref:Uncharacterized protein n=1 Tax=Corticibacter populi TaxID=1550736 RepID=A0A3M6QZ26_9BURK|nr:hypothetical protein [Corticibacter populi]RMX08228.1 hypothetical protein D8I35_03720 [Corticibacter populi]RZS35502.1 hypothetical protein EV687_0570 [Corticibacter populi]